MSEYIDRQAAINALSRGSGCGTSCHRALKTLPSADVVEVVRCIDCKWYKTNYSWNGNEHMICAKEAYEPVRKADDYCSYGERKDG